MTTNMNKNIKLILCVLLLLSVVIAHADNSPASAVYAENAGQSTVDFYATGRPSMLKIHGTDDQITGKLSASGDQVTGSFSVNMTQFSTGMKLRDDHLRNKIFQIEQYPLSELTLGALTLKNGAYDGPFQGKLKFHGIEKDIAGQATVAIKDKQITQKANFTIKLADFNIPKPEFAGMKIDDEVKIEVTGKGIAQ